ncbi:MAG: hypothetical protein KTR35_09055 [Gammaproteobacteria bacterium]|nr:hypothetical protein [Gammaproteobacteria bacterium]
MGVKRVVGIFAALLALSACDSDSSRAEPDIEDPEIISSCQTIDATSSSESLSLQLPVSLAMGQTIVLEDAPELSVEFFDNTSGVLTLLTPRSHAPLSIRYSVVDANNTVLFEHTHWVVFQPLRVMPYGDSITSGVEYFDGTDLPELPVRVGYRKALYDSLTMNGYLVDFLGQAGQRAGQDAGLIDPDNNGFSGVDIGFLRAKLNEVLLENPPDVLLIHIGTNNTPTTADELMLLLDDIDVWEQQHHPVTVHLATIVPTRNASENLIVEQYNEDIRTRVQNRVGDRLVLVEQNLAVSPDDISDEPIGKHPTAAGYEKMATAWYESMLAYDTVARCLP